VLCEAQIKQGENMTAIEIIKILYKKNTEYQLENHQVPTTLYISRNLCDTLLNECNHIIENSGELQIYGLPITELETPDCIYFGGCYED
jgi:hypothetical protein